MNSKAYITKIQISGIKNIKKEINIDFYGKNIDENIDTEKYRIKGIYGENGSGKTAIITAVSIVKEFVLDDSYLRDFHNQLLLKELINKKTKKFTFKCEFVFPSETLLIYEYEVHFSFDKNDEIYVSLERLSYKRKSSRNVQNLLFECKNGELKCLEVSEKNKKIFYEKSNNLLLKQSVLKTLLVIDLDEKLTEENINIVIYAWLFFKMIFTYYDNEDKHISFYQKNKIRELEKTKQPINQIIGEIEKSIYSYGRKIKIAYFKEYKMRIKKMENFIRLFKPSLKKIEIEKKQDKEFYDCELIMNYGDYKIHREFESAGIKRIMDLYDAIKMASMGAIVFIDEMDSNINDIYLCKIIEYLKRYGKGQLCFTMHNTSPMAVIKDNSKSIDFLTNDNKIVSWTKNGHYTPENMYRSGMIEGMPFNIDASDFINIFEEV